MYCRSHSLRIAALGIALSPLTLAVQAQAEDVSALDAVIVTGETLSRDLQNTATSVSVLTGADLERSSDVNLYDSFERVANVMAVGGDKGIVMRGITQTGPGGSGSGRTINISVDGASLPTTQSTFFGPYSGWDLQQVEVLRGPQSTQQGRNALAGAVNIRSADPEFDQYGKARMRVEGNNGTALALMYNTAINDEFAVRFAGEQSSSDGWVSNPTRDEDDYDGRELTSGRFKVLYEPSDDLRVVFSHSRTNSTGGEDYVDFNSYPDQRLNSSDGAADEYSKHKNTGLRISYQLNPLWSLESETTLYKHDYRRLEDFDFSALPGGVIDRTTDDKGISQEFKFIYDNGTDLRGAVGLYMTQIDTQWNDALAADASLLDPRIPAGASIITRTVDRSVDTENIAVFGELDYDLNDRWTLTAGARYDYEKIEATDDTLYTQNPVVVPVLPAGASGQNDTAFNAFLPKVAATYHWNEDVNTSFTVQRGYRAGGTSLNPFTLEMADFNPEYTWNYELAVRSTLLDGRMTLNGNLFYTDWEDQQVLVNGASGNPNDISVTNAGQSSLYGLEIDMAYRVSEQLELYTGLGFVKTEFDDFVNQNTDYSGNEFPYAPQMTAALGGEYRFDQNWFMQLNANYIADHFSFADNDTDAEIPSRWVVNTRAGFEREDWSVVLYARNLLDENYFTQRNVSSSYDLVRSGEPLTVGLELNASF